MEAVERRHLTIDAVHVVPKIPWCRMPQRAISVAPGTEVIAQAASPAARNSEKQGAPAAQAAVIYLP